MASFDWKPIVATVAPTLATALGGPLAGVAVAALSEALLGRKDGTETEIAGAIQAGGADALVKIREAGNAFAIRMRELEIDVERIHQTDRASAREREAKTGDRVTPRVLAFVVVAGFLATVFAVLSGRVTGIADPVAAGLIGTLIGYVSAKCDQVVSYYFGSSSGSQEKTSILAGRK